MTLIVVCFVYYKQLITVFIEPVEHLAGAFALVTDNRRCGYEHEYKQCYLQRVFRCCIRIERGWKTVSRYGLGQKLHLNFCLRLYLNRGS